jgi:hypothetical protein
VLHNLKIRLGILCHIGKYFVKNYFFSSSVGFFSARMPIFGMISWISILNNSKILFWFLEHPDTRVSYKFLGKNSFFSSFVGSFSARMPIFGMVSWILSTQQLKYTFWIDDSNFWVFYCCKPVKNKTISLLIECMVDFMWIFEKKWVISPTFTLMQKQFFGLTK